jgi:hypothetical protein
MRVLCTIGTRIRSRNTTSNIVLWPFSYGIKTIQILHLYHSNMVFWSFLYDTQTQGWSWAWAQRATTRLKKIISRKHYYTPAYKTLFGFPRICKTRTRIERNRAGKLRLRKRQSHDRTPPLLSTYARHTTTIAPPHFSGWVFNLIFAKPFSSLKFNLC